MDEFITKDVHEEFAKRVEEENNRQNHRIQVLEDALTKITQLVTAVEKLATNMEHMSKEQETQGSRLQALEAKDGKMWEKVVTHIVTGIISLILGFVACAIGLK